LFILGLILGYLCCLWHIPLYLFDLIDARLYPLAIFFSVEPPYVLIAQVYVFSLVNLKTILFNAEGWGH
jgi:hypothetical protein